MMRETIRHIGLNVRNAMTKKRQKIECILFAHYFSSHRYYSGKKYLLVACSRHFGLIKEKENFPKKCVIDGDVLATST
jgi:hypothetical protein